MLLPYLDQAPLFQSVDFSVDYDAAVNAAVKRTKLPALMCPSAPEVADSTYAPHNYPTASAAHGYGLCGRHGGATTNGIFASSWGLRIRTSTGPSVYSDPAMPQMRLRSITDGTSNTVTFSEFAKGLDYVLPTSHKNNMGRSWFDGNVGYGNIGFSTTTTSTPNNPNPTYSTTVNWGTVGSYHTGGVHCAFMDGSVRFVSENISGIVWRDICTPQNNRTNGEF